MSEADCVDHIFFAIIAGIAGLILYIDFLGLE